METGTISSKYLYNCTLAKQPVPVGYWVLYPGDFIKTKFAMYSRPTDEQIKNTETLLGWAWEEHKNE